MSDEPNQHAEELLAEVLYAHERKTYVGYPPWREARYGEPHVVGARNTCLYTARAVLRSDWYAERIAEARAEGAAEVAERIEAVAQYDRCADRYLIPRAGFRAATLRGDA